MVGAKFLNLGLGDCILITRRDKNNQCSYRVGNIRTVWT